jgi:type IV pilus assembly protein PilM
MGESIWKKEISFGRKPKESTEAQQPEAAETASAPSEQPTSVWKKELSFGRKKAPKQPKAPKQKAEKSAKAEGESASVWKKEISFGRKKAPKAPEPVVAEEAAAVPQPEPVAAPEPELELGPVPDAVAHVLAPVSPEPADVEPDYEFLAPDPVAAVDPEPEPVVPVEAWEAAPEVPPAPEPTPPVVLHLEPSPEPEPIAAEASAAPVVVHPPVPEAELPPVPSEKVPFWKKDLSFGGGKPKQPKEKKPKAEKTPKEPKEKRAKAPKQPRRLRAPKIEKSGGKGAKRLVGLKVGASQLAAARVSNNGVAELLQVAREPLNPGIVVGGELREPDALAEALREFFKKNRLPTKGVRLGIANNRIGVRTFEIDGIDDPKQLDNAIKFRAQETLPIPIEDAVLDYQILGEEAGENGQRIQKVLLVVAYRDLVDRYVDACRKAGITLAGIDLEAFALLRALQAPQAGAGGDAQAALVAVAIGHERSTFAVSDGRICEFTRVLEWGGAALNIALARTLDAAPSEVEEIKRDLPLTTETVPEGLTAERAAQARDAMRRAIQVFARELVSSLQFYQNQPGSLGIGEIVLSGGTAHLIGLAEELERLIGVRVRVGDPLARMKVSKKVGDPEQVGSLAVAIGLGIED